MKAQLSGALIAESDDVIEVDGYVYFPAHSVKKSALKESNFSSFCPDKGRANYWHVECGGVQKANAAFAYKEPKGDMAHLANRIGFYASRDAVANDIKLEE